MPSPYEVLVGDHRAFQKQPISDHERIAITVRRAQRSQRWADRFKRWADRLRRISDRMSRGARVRLARLQ
jgi:hypothetical protein